MFRHWQNLNDLPGGGQGSAIRHGRCAIGRCRAEWTVLKFPRLGVSFGTGGDNAFEFSIKLLIFSFYFHVEGGRGEEREFNLYWNEKAIWLALWQNPWESRKSDPWWKKMHVLHLDDLLFGRRKYTTEALKEIEAFVPMPEGAYPATIKMERCTWRRPRLPRFTALVVLRADIQMKKPIPVEGKGENSWDCGEDAIYSLCTAAKTAEEAIAKIVESAMSSRKRYGTPASVRGKLAMAV